MRSRQAGSRSAGSSATPIGARGLGLFSTSGVIFLGAAIRAGDTKYTAVDGTPALKQAICDKFKRENGLDYSPDEITVGTFVSFFGAMAFPLYSLCLAHMNDFVRRDDFVATSSAMLTL